MTHVLWRIATDATTYFADDLSGMGAKITGGRWNEINRAMVYASSTRALACLETVVHLNSGGLPLNRYLIELQVEDAVWAAAQHETSATLPVGWDAEPCGKTSMDFGTRWLTGRGSALLVVPSVIVQEEVNVLINPEHADAAKITAKKIRRWTYDSRLVKK